METGQRMKGSLPCTEKEKCCGCCVCSEICPVQAIAMIEDAEGFLYPYLDEMKCIRCNLCRKVCPANENDPDYSVSQEEKV